MSTRKRSGATVLLAERRHRAVQLRRRGQSYREIAEALSISVGQAHSDVRSALDALPQLDAELHRRESLERLDAAVSGLWTTVAAGDPKAVYALVQVEARRAALLGLDMPVRSEIAIQNTETRRRLQLVAEVEAMTDEELVDSIFATLGRVLRDALAADPALTLDTLAKAGFVAGFAEPHGPHAARHELA